MKHGPYRTPPTIPDRIEAAGATYYRLTDLERDALIPLLASEVHAWYGPGRDRLTAVLTRLGADAQ